MAARQRHLGETSDRRSRPLVLGLHPKTARLERLLHTSRQKKAIWLLACLSASACAAPIGVPLSDDEKLVRATLQVLSADGSQICVDASTTGRPLSVYRIMASNPPAGVKPVWFVPASLKPPQALSDAELYRGAQADGTAHIDQPGNMTAVLPSRAQAQLDRAAWILSERDPNPTVTISPSWGLVGVKPRWWLRNRLSRHCAPNYQISDPVTANNIGYVTVTAEHWGTTYAFTRSGSDWVARAQWSNWLY